MNIQRYTKTIVKKYDLKKRYKRLRKQPVYHAYARLVHHRMFARIFALSALVILLASSAYWAYLGAKLQNANADALVDPYLFQNMHTLHQAVFPGAHTFLIKWPFFWLVSLLGYRPGAYIGVTIAVVLLTVGGLYLLLTRLERRPVARGVISLAVASMLLLVPTVPYAGGILPVNMAMLATRNLEYVWYLACLAAIARATTMRSWRFLAATAGLALLIASDQLFLSVGAAAALVSMVLFTLLKGWKLVSLSVSWLVATVLAGVAAKIITAGINSSGLTHIANTSGASPYGLVQQAHQALLGGIYGLLGVLTNFGANPAYDTPTLSSLPRHALMRLRSVEGLTFLINGLVFIVVIGAFIVFGYRFMAERQRKKVENSSAQRFGLLVVLSGLASIGLFIISNHYYAADARYEALAFFAGVVVLAVSSRGWRYNPEFVAPIGLVLLVAIACGASGAYRDYNAQTNALSEVQLRNSLVSKALHNHHVSYVVGDYWRVVPIKQLAVKQTTIVPLQNCTQPRTILTSEQWGEAAQKRSFAYVLSLDKSLTDYPQCSADQIQAAFGRPNASLLIRGSFERPKELLLFYDHGIRRSAPRADKHAPPQTSLQPIPISDVPYASCYGPTVMNIVAHQDDDLLFLSPDLLHSIHEGNCVRTVYLTAGDAGYGSFFWTSRQQGSEAAYSSMLGISDVWIQRTVRLADGRYATIANPKGNSKISLIFLNLPDGSLRGDGFANNHFQSLAKLRDGKIGVLETVDHQSTFTATQLISDLTTLMHLYQPSEIHSQADYHANQFTDHSDHMAVKWFAEQAHAHYQAEQFGDRVSIPIKYYLGYPTREREQNVGGDDLAQKEMAFLTYAKFDGGVCQSVEDCAQTPTYGSYLTRQYTQE